MYHENYYKLIGIDLPRQTNTSIPWQIKKNLKDKIHRKKFTGKLEEDDGEQCFLLLKSNKNYAKLFFKFLNCHGIM